LETLAIEEYLENPATNRPTHQSAIPQISKSATHQPSDFAIPRFRNPATQQFCNSAIPQISKSSIQQIRNPKIKQNYNIYRFILYLASALRDGYVPQKKD